MATWTLGDIAEKMADIDFCMLATQEAGSSVTGRPMSNNGDVDYDGDSWFFAYEQSAKIRQLEANDNVTLTFAGAKRLLGAPGVFLSVEGRAELVRDKAAFDAHYHKGLDRWFPQGTDTPGMILIKVNARKIRYWDGEDEGTLAL